jgi:hypothetical protein
MILYQITVALCLRFGLIHAHSLQCLGTLFGKFKEKKANVVTALHDALDKVFPLVPLDKVSESYKTVRDVL